MFLKVKLILCSSMFLKITASLMPLLGFKAWDLHMLKETTWRRKAETGLRRVHYNASWNRNPLEMDYVIDMYMSNKKYINGLQVLSKKELLLFK